MAPDPEGGHQPTLPIVRGLGKLKVFDIFRLQLQICLRPGSILHTPNVSCCATKTCAEERQVGCIHLSKGIEKKSPEKAVARVGGSTGWTIVVAGAAARLGSVVRPPAAAAAAVTAAEADALSFELAAFEVAPASVAETVVS